MPMYRMRCEVCGAVDRLLTPNSVDRPEMVCPHDGGIMVREATGPGAQKVEVLDNGAMARAVERPADAERLWKERHDSADPLAGLSLKPAND